MNIENKNEPLSLKLRASSKS